MTGPNSGSWTTPTTISTPRGAIAWTSKPSVAPWWKGLAGGAAVLSLLLCLAWWNDAKAGVVIDLLIVAGLVIATWVLRPAVV